MRRARPRPGVPALVCAAALGIAIAGCGSRPRGDSDLSFERMTDSTAALSQGEPLLRAFEPYRMDNGAMRVRGRVEMPDGTRLQVAVRRPGQRVTVQMVQVTVEGGQFDSPPMVGATGPLPVDRWEFEVLAHFTPEWQSAAVLRATGDGRALRGPGITRTTQGTATFQLVQEARL